MISIQSTCSRLALALLSACVVGNSGCQLLLPGSAVSGIPAPDTQLAATPVSAIPIPAPAGPGTPVPGAPIPGAVAMPSPIPQTTIADDQVFGSPLPDSQVWQDSAVADPMQRDQWVAEFQQPFVPRELDKVTLPMYRIAAPDILSIDVQQNVAPATHALQPGDVVALTVLGTFPDEPIVGEYQVQVGGGIELGYTYPVVEVAGRTVEEAADLIEAQLMHQLREPRVSISLRQVAGVQPIAGEHLVGPDGTVTLGQYGSVRVAGMTLDEARLTIAAHLSGIFTDPKVSVSVFAFNSKAIYLITQGGGLGDRLVRLPYTGNETVMDALSQINGLSYVSSSRMWVARPNRGSGTSLILPIDWEAMTQHADVTTNYQLLPGDRLYVAQNKLVAIDSAIARFTSPFERLLGFTLLGTATASRLSGKVLSRTYGQGGF